MSRSEYLVFQHKNTRDIAIEKYIFDKQDVNGDGYLDREEFKAFIREMTERNAEPDQRLVDAIIEKIDANKDVRIDYKEFKQFTETM
jgi:Ca2+-binding EF-hand superfamily protein